MLTHPPQPVATIEFWFDFASNYSYLSTMRIQACAHPLGVKILWKPFLLGPIFSSFDWDNSPFVLQKKKGEYVWVDMVRQCEKYSLEWKQPAVFPRLSVLPSRLAFVAKDEPWIGEFCKKIMRMNFVEDCDIHSPTVVERVLQDMKLPAQSWIELAQTESNKLAFRRQTDMAQAKGIFGAPTFFVKDHMFWGNDRLDDALAYCAQQHQNNSQSILLKTDSFN